MSARLNSADRVVASAIGALVAGFHRPVDEIAMCVDIVRHALPHTNERVPVMHALIPVAMELIDMPDTAHDGTGSWPAWRYKAQQDVVAFHRFELGEAQVRMHEALARRVA